MQNIIGVAVADCALRLAVHPSRSLPSVVISFNLPREGPAMPIPSSPHFAGESSSYYFCTWHLVATGTYCVPSFVWDEQY